MKTDAVMCIGLTRQRPSLIPLSASAASTSSVMLTKPMRDGTFIVRTFRKDFILSFSVEGLQPLVGALVEVAPRRGVLLDLFEHAPRVGLAPFRAVEGAGAEARRVRLRRR